MLDDGIQDGYEFLFLTFLPSLVPYRKICLANGFVYMPEVSLD